MPPRRTCRAWPSSGLRPDAPVRHRARRPAAGLPPGRAGHHGRGGARAPAAQGALRGRLVDPAAARARGWSTPPSTSSRSSSSAKLCTPSCVEAGKWEWAEQEFAHVMSFATPPRAAGAVATYLRAAQGPRPPRARRGAGPVGRPRRHRLDRDVTPGRIIPDSAIVEAACAAPRDRETPAGAARVPRPRRAALRQGWLAGAARRAGAPRHGAAAPQRPLRWPAAATGVGRQEPGRRRAAGPGPRRARSSWPESSRCRWRTCSRPRAPDACCGSRPATGSRRRGRGAGRAGRAAVADRGHRRADLLAAITDHPDPA